MPRVSNADLGSLIRLHSGPGPFESFPTGTPHAALARSRTSARPIRCPAPATRPEGRPTCTTLNSRSVRPPLHAPRPERFPPNTRGRGLAVARVPVTLAAAHAQSENPVGKPEELFRKSRLRFLRELSERNRRLPAGPPFVGPQRNWERVPEQLSRK